MNILDAQKPDGGVAERRARIAELLAEKGFLQIEDLAEVFAVTPQTIRRDAMALCDSGLAQRTHRGIKTIAFATAENIAYSRRAAINLLAKRKIAALLAAMIPSGASVSLGIGTTPEVVARQLLKHRDLFVVTNNLNVAMALSGNSSITVQLCGGRMRNGDRDVLGAQAVELFARHEVDFGVTGVGGIDEGGSFLDFSDDEVSVRQSIIANCRHAVLIADASKFGRAAPVRGGSLTAIKTFVTDTRPADAFVTLAKEYGVSLLYPT
jgi:DeoR family transcriptional regulator, glycerol-3-phosphate regulon repressor